MTEKQRDEHQESDTAEDQAEAFTFRPDYQAPFPTVYSNFALVSHTSDELAVDFCLVAPPYHPNAETKTVPVSVIARVIVPPALVQGLIEALRIQLEKQTSERQVGLTIPPMKKPEHNADA